VKGATKPLLESATSAVTLANEKVYNPYLLIQKKTYAGLKFTLKGSIRGSPTSIDDFDKCIDMKGIDAVRRDRSKLVKTLSTAILDALLIKKSLKEALDVIRVTLSTVAKQEAPLDWFILSKSLKGTYASENQPHVQAWRRMAARGDADIPEIGTRMPFVVTVGSLTKKGPSPLYERAEHPEYVRVKKIAYDAKYYLENARDVIERLLAPTTEGPIVKKLFEQAFVDAEHKSSGNMSLASFMRKKPRLE
jgi:DNA polymerase elongation subunit (family B)